MQSPKTKTWVAFGLTGLVCAENSEKQTPLESVRFAAHAGRCVAQTARVWGPRDVQNPLLQVASPKERALGAPASLPAMLPGAETPNERHVY